MGIVKGASALMDATKSTGSANRINFFKLEDGESIFVRFLQELDYDSEHYNDDAGVGLIAIEHNAPGPQGWKKKALCTIDEEEGCWACEQFSKTNSLEWRPKSRLYINLLAEVDGKEVVQVWNASKTVAAYLLEFSSEEGGITNRRFKVTRSGRGTETKYIMMGKAADNAPFDFSALEMVDVEERLLKSIAYEDQEEFYLGSDEEDSGDTVSDSISWG